MEYHDIGLDHVSLVEQDGAFDVVHVIAKSTYGPMAMAALGLKGRQSTRLSKSEATNVARLLDAALNKSNASKPPKKKKAA